jgi:hypothetical protein
VWHQSVTSSLVLFMLASLEKYARDKRSSLFSPQVTQQKRLNIGLDRSGARNPKHDPGTLEADLPATRNRTRFGFKFLLSTPP